MSKYVFILRKKNLEIELVSPDSEFISKQMKAWQELFIKGFGHSTQTSIPAATEEISVLEDPQKQIVLNEEDESTLADLDQTLQESASLTEEIQEAIESEEEGPTGIDKLIAKPISSEMDEMETTQNDEPEVDENELTVPPFEEYNEEQLEKEAVPASEIQTDYVNQLMADMEGQETQDSEPENFIEEEIPQEPAEIEEEVEEEPEIDGDELTAPPFEEYDLEQLEKEAVPASEMQTDYVNQLMANMESGTEEVEYSDGPETKDSTEEEIDLSELLAEAQEEQEEADVRVTPSEKEEITDDANDFSSLLEEFEAETEEVTPEEPADKLSEELPPQEIAEEEDLDSLLSAMASEEEPPNEEPLLEGVLEEAITGTEEVPAEEPLLEGVLEEAITDTEEASSEDPLLEGVLDETTDSPEEHASAEDDLLATLQAEVEEESNSEEDLLATLQAEANIEEEPEAKPEVPEAVQKIKQEIQEKKDAVPIEAFYSSLTIKTPVDILLATAVYMEKFQEKLKFTQKDISALTYKAIKKPVSPNIILAAVNKSYIEVVPDFTGTSESNEYSLTDTGRDYVLSELS